MNSSNCFEQKYIQEIACGHGKPDNCQNLHEHVLSFRLTVNLWPLWVTSKQLAPLLSAWQNPDTLMYVEIFLNVFGQISPVHLSALLLFSWILTITCRLIPSSILIIGKKSSFENPMVKGLTHIVVYWVTERPKLKPSSAPVMWILPHYSISSCWCFLP